MRAILIVSKCLKVSKSKSKKKQYFFHFKGVFEGKKVKILEIIDANGLDFLPGEDYIVYGRLVNFHQGLLKLEAVKSKALDQCIDQS